MHSDPPVDWSTSGNRNDISMGIPTSAGSTNTAQVKCSGTVTATLTWVKDDKLPSDPAPPSVWVTETADAEWHGQGNISGGNLTASSSGSASDGLSDPEVPNPTSDVSTISHTTTAHLTKVSGGTITRTCTISIQANCSGTSVKPTSGQVYINALWSYSVGIHATPYNFHDVGYTDINGVHHGGPEISTGQGSAGTLLFHYAWNSTTGNIADLTSCTFYEYITWSGAGGASTDQDGKPIWLLPSPPVVSPYFYYDPLIQTKPATDGASPDVFNPPPFIQPCTGPDVTWTGNQQYYFDDSATGEKKVPMPGPDAGPFDIVRHVSLRSSGASGQIWKYTITRAGYTAEKWPL